jgi:dTDP-4-dehydrorhamnose reductase
LITLTEPFGGVPKKVISLKNVLIVGASGMAGHVMAKYYKDNEIFNVFGIGRREDTNIDEVIDATNFSELEKAIHKIQPDFIINCVGVLVQQSNSYPSQAILVNSYLPHFLSKLGKQYNYRLIHLSTDCVFSGNQGNYIESSFRDGDDTYARTKALGEIDNKRDLTIRTSIIGPESKYNGTGLMDWYFREDHNIEGYSNVFWSGVTTLELAKAVVEFINQGVTGLYHLSPKSKISKFNLLNLFKQVWDTGVEIIPNAKINSDKSILSTRTDFSYPQIYYKKMLNELNSWINANRDIYEHYSKIL